MIYPNHIQHHHHHRSQISNHRMSIRQRGNNRKQSEEENINNNTLSSGAGGGGGGGGRSLSRRALTQTANLANLLPTGTLLAFQILTPVFTNNGSCDSVTRMLTHLLLILLSLSCFLASFTDTVKASDGRVYHGLATLKGLWLFDSDPSTSGLPDLSKYRVRLIDWVHALLSLLVFSVVALRDKNVLSCYYPDPARETRQVLDILPLGIGLLCSLLFAVFPTTRHGVGYPITTFTPPPAAAAVK